MAKVEKKAVKPAAVKKETDPKKVLAYCVKTKTMEEVSNPVVEKTERGQYMVKGTATKDKHKVAAIVSADRAEYLVKNKLAKKGY